MSALEKKKESEGGGDENAKCLQHLASVVTHPYTDTHAQGTEKKTQKTTNQKLSSCDGAVAWSYCYFK